MFLVTTPSGRTFEYVHRLVPGELYNNSFVTISPDSQWMVAGEWETMSHLQIYPTPLLNHRSPARGGSLRLAGYIKLDHKVNDVQGCDFVTPVRLICASDDDSRTLFRNAKPLVEIDLAAPLDGTSVRGHVVDLGSIPQESACSGTFEAEGVDFDTSTDVLRVEVIQPGSLHSQDDRSTSTGRPADAAEKPSSIRRVLRSDAQVGGVAEHDGAVHPLGGGSCEGYGLRTQRGP